MPDMWNTPEQEQRSAAEYIAARIGARRVRLQPLTTGLWRDVNVIDSDGREMTFSLNQIHMDEWRKATHAFAGHVYGSGSSDGSGYVPDQDTWDLWARDADGPDFLTVQAARRIAAGERVS